MTRPRSPGANDASRIARLPGVSSAPPTPCRPRAAISSSMLGAVAQMSDATANHATPTMNRRRRPNRSLRLRSAASVPPASAGSRPRPTAARDRAWKSLPMAGCAMPTTLPSSMAIELPSTVAVSTQRPRPVERCRPSAPLMARLRVVAPGQSPHATSPKKPAGFGCRLVCGDTRAAVGDRGVDAVPGHHHRLLRQREQPRRDALDEGLEVALRGRLARTSVEQRVAGDHRAADEQRDAARVCAPGCAGR